MKSQRKTMLLGPVSTSGVWVSREQKLTVVACYPDHTSLNLCPGPTMSQTQVQTGDGIETKRSLEQYFSSCASTGAGHSLAMLGHAFDGVWSGHSQCQSSPFPDHFA